MAIMDRIKLNARANLNYILDKAENPQKMLDQFLVEMRESVRGVKEAVVAAIVGVKKLEREISEDAEKAAQWREKAVLALKMDNEELARKALEQRRVYLERESRGKAELEKYKLTVEELKASLSEMEVKLDELYQKRIDLIKQYAQLQKRAAAQITADRPTVTEINIDTSVIDNYDRMVDKVMTMEAQVEALAELEKGDEVEEQFRKLERETEIETELKSIKDKMKT